MRLKYFSALVLAASFASVTAHADTFVWATWTTDTPGASAAAGGTASATMPGFTITYTGQLSGLNAGPSWNPPHSTWIGGVVSNGPPVDATSVHMEGGPNPGTETITFSGPVANPVLAIWSLGEPGLQTSFDFNSSEPFTIAGGGPNAEYGGSGLVLNLAGTGVTGNEGNGLIELLGVYTSITFTTPDYENYYNFTIGEDQTVTSTLATPQPSPSPQPSRSSEWASQRFPPPEDLSHAAAPNFCRLTPLGESREERRFNLLKTRHRVFTHVTGGSSHLRGSESPDTLELPTRSFISTIRPRRDGRWQMHLHTEYAIPPK